MIKVKSHTRGKSVVRAHKRKPKKSAAWVKLHPRYKVWGDRVSDNTPTEEVMRKKSVLTKELTRMQNGYYSSIQDGHMAFILRRLKNVNSVLAKRIKQE